MARKWLRDLDLIQIKAALWQGDSPLSISRQFLVTQSTISAIKHGRLHPESEWPDGSTGPIPPAKETELYRQQRMGMLRRSEIATGRGHMVRDTHLQMPPPIEEQRTEKEIWWGAYKDSDKDDKGTKYTHDELEAFWLIEEQKRKDAKDAKEQERLAKEAEFDRLRTDAERDYVESTPEEREREAEEQRQSYALSHIWRPNKGGLNVENLLAANLSDDEIMGMVATDSKARRFRKDLEEFIEARRMAATSSISNETPNNESPTDKESE